MAHLSVISLHLPFVLCIYENVFIFFFLYKRFKQNQFKMTYDLAWYAGPLVKLWNWADTDDDNNDVLPYEIKQTLYK